MLDFLDSNDIEGSLLLFVLDIVFEGLDTSLFPLLCP